LFFSTAEPRKRPDSGAHGVTSHRATFHRGAIVAPEAVLTLSNAMLNHAVRAWPTLRDDSASGYRQGYKKRTIRIYNV